MVQHASASALGGGGSGKGRSELVIDGKTLSHVLGARPPSLFRSRLDQ